MCKGLFCASTDFERGQLRIKIIGVSVIISSILRQLFLFAMLINANAIIGSLLLMFKKRIGLHLYRINIFVSCFYLLFSNGVYIFSGVGGYWGWNNNLFYIMELLILVPAVHFVKTDYCIDEYFAIRNRKSRTNM